MSDSIGGGTNDPITGAAHGVAGGVQDAVDQVHRAVCGAACGVGEMRAAIRAQPITAAVVIFTLGYFVGSILHSRRL